MNDSKEEYFNVVKRMSEFSFYEKVKSWRALLLSLFCFGIFLVSVLLFGAALWLDHYTKSTVALLASLALVLFGAFVCVSITLFWIFNNKKVLSLITLILSYNLLLFSALFLASAFFFKFGWYIFSIFVLVSIEALAITQMKGKGERIYLYASLATCILGITTIILSFYNFSHPKEERFDFCWIWFPWFASDISLMICLVILINRFHSKWFRYIFDIENYLLIPIRIVIPVIVCLSWTFKALACVSLNNERGDGPCYPQSNLIFPNTISFIPLFSALFLLSLGSSLFMFFFFERIHRKPFTINK